MNLEKLILEITKKAKKRLSFSANLLAFFVIQTILNLTQPTPKILTYQIYMSILNINVLQIYLNYYTS